MPYGYLPFSFWLSAPHREFVFAREMFWIFPLQLVYSICNMKVSEITLKSVFERKPLF